MKNEIFEANPQLDCYFETTDGACFFTENAAKDHARSLTEKAVTPYHKSNYVVVDSVEEIEVVGSVEGTSDSELAKQFEVIDEVIVPTAPVEPVAPVEPKATEGKAKNQKK
jgi:hypothetical protein